jgi:drug/metabolite transporter (DMT)-like permease
MMDRAAYGLALAAIALWSGLAAAAHALGGRDPLVVTGLGLLLGGLLGAPRWQEWKVPYATRLVGVGGILGYHLLYFSAFARAPAAAPTINLLNYLWPLLIVVLAPAISGERPTLRHLLGALLGLLGTVAILLGRIEQAAALPWTACAMAVAAALIWALYSLLTRRLPPFPTAAVGGFCVVSGAGALGVAAAHGSLAPTLHALGWWEWLVIAGMGIGPLGLAFFCWDAALKRGDPRAIGTLAYLAPLLSTAWLLLFPGARLGWHLAVALVLIVGGAVLGGWPAARPERGTQRTTRVRR